MVFYMKPVHKTGKNGCLFKSQILTQSYDTYKEISMAQTQEQNKPPEIDPKGMEVYDLPKK